ncbi:MAG TPA: phosphatase PAP2 family protein [Gemmatimonadaceae bacterium]|nr:phosphatase PAP2 family protein [Gemmatimonadaceae bacterium]
MDTKVFQRFERFERFLRNRLNRETYIGLHLTVSLVVAGLAIWLSGAMLEAVLDNDTVVRLDIVAAHWIHSRARPTGITVSEIISAIGSPTTMGVIAVVGGAILLARRRLTMLFTWIAVFAGGGSLEKLLKEVVHRTRPEFTPTAAVEQSLSFPSGHTMMCAIGMGMLVYMLTVPRHMPRPWRGVLIGLAVSLVLAVGISRVYLGAHYPSDVLGGLAFGVAWVSICVAVSGLAHHRRGRSLARKRAKPR